MPHRVLALALIMTPGFGVLASSQAGPGEQSLRVAHETLVAGVKNANLALLQGLIHPQALGFFRESQFPVQLRAGYTAAEALPSLVTDLGRFVAVPTDTVYRVVDRVGVVCMTASLRAKQGEKQPDRFLRGTYVYALVEGNWKLLSWHGSDTPLVKR